MKSGKTKPLEVYKYGQVMKQIKEEKRHKKRVSMIKTVAKITEEISEEDEINMDSDFKK